MLRLAVGEIKGFLGVNQTAAVGASWLITEKAIWP
jgi:hypothetical protein